MLKFTRLMLGRESQLPVHVKNNGILPATGRIDMQSHHAFSLEGGSRVFSVESKKVEMFNLGFHPKQIGVFQHNVEIKVRCPYFKPWTWFLLPKECEFLGICLILFVHVLAS